MNDISYMNANMRKQATRVLIRRFSAALFRTIKHGKKRHRNWLRNKMKNFTAEFCHRKVK